MDMPTKFYPRPEKFVETFLGGQVADTGLNTAATPSRVHAAHDKWDMGQTGKFV